MIDRSKLKNLATPLKAIKDLNKETDSKIGKGSFDRPGIVKIEEGLNTFRLYPCHPDGGGKTFYEPLVMWYLPFEVDEKNEKGEVIKGKKKVIQKPIFHAKIHGDGNKKDIVEEYKKFAEKLSKVHYENEDSRKEFLKPLIPVKGKGGLKETQSYSCYAHKVKGGEKQFGRLEFKKAVEIGLNKISAIESANDPLGTDPFTDIENGSAITINYNPKATQATDFYTIMKAPETEIVNGKKEIISYALTDEDLEIWLKAVPLHKLYSNVYSKKDFDLAVEGLKNFDKDSKLGIFEYEEWIDIISTMRNEYSDIKGEVKSEKVEGDEFDEMDREELKEFAKENKTGILVKPSHKDDQIRNLLREWVNVGFTEDTNPDKTDLPFEGESEEVSEDVEEIKEESPKPNSTKDRLASIRSKINKG